MIYAYTAIANRAGFMIGKATLGQAGYNPEPVFGFFESYNDAGDAADRMNRERGINELDAAYIVGDTMRRQNEANKPPTELRDAIIEHLAEQLDEGAHHIYFDALFGDGEERTFGDAVAEASMG